jgi:hypothetical protein
MLTKKIYNVETQETQELPLSESEVKELAAEDKLLQVKLDALTKTATDKAALLAKLGITADEAKLLLS